MVEVKGLTAVFNWALSLNGCNLSCNIRECNKCFHLTPDFDLRNGVKRGQETGANSSTSPRSNSRKKNRATFRVYWFRYIPTLITPFHPVSNSWSVRIFDTYFREIVIASVAFKQASRSTRGTRNRLQGCPTDLEGSSLDCQRQGEDFQDSVS